VVRNVWIVAKTRLMDPGPARMISASFIAMRATIPATMFVKIIQAFLVAVKTVTNALRQVQMVKLLVMA